MPSRRSRSWSGSAAIEPAIPLLGSRRCAPLSSPATAGPRSSRSRSVATRRSRPGEVRIAVRAAGINFADLLARTGMYPDAPKPPSRRRLRGCGRGRVGGGGGHLGLGRRPGDGGYPVRRLRRAGRRRRDARSCRCPIRSASSRARRCRSTTAPPMPALVIMGGLRDGDRVLIHAAAGGRGHRRDPGREAARAPRSSARRRPPSTTRSALRGSTTRSTTGPRTSRPRSMRITAGEGIDVAFDAIGPSSFRKDYRLLRPGRAPGLLRAQRGPDRGGAEHRGVLEGLRRDDDGDDAVVEEPRDHEREQGGLRAQHARLVGPGGEPDPRDRAARSRTSPPGASSRWSPRPSPSIAPPTPTDSSTSAERRQGRARRRERRCRER